MIIFALILFPIIIESFAEDTVDKLSEKEICEKDFNLIDGICMPKSIWTSSDFRGLQTGESISHPEVIIIIQSLGAILIILFIVIYAVKKRIKKNKN